MSLRLVAALVIASSAVLAQQLNDRPGTTTSTPAKTPNSNATYQALKNAGLSGESSEVNNLVLKRDVASFTFSSGTFYFLQPVNGKITGAVFQGSGMLKIDPATAGEHNILQLFDRNGYDEKFSLVVLRFTDGTYDEIKRAFPTKTGPAHWADELKDARDLLKHTLHYNLDGRILNDVLSSGPGGLFWAFVHGSRHGDKQLFEIDPHGVVGFLPTAGSAPFHLVGFLPERFGPEEVLFQTYTEDDFGIWLCEHFAKEYEDGKASGRQPNGFIDISRHVISTSIEKNGHLQGDDAITFTAIDSGLAVVPFDLFSHLRVQSVTGAAGEPLDFIQESEKEDWGFFVVLPRTLSAAEQYTIRPIYAGKDAITNEGGGNYNVAEAARGNWYPNSYFGDFAEYRMSFKAPKKMKLVATGKLLREAEEGGFAVSDWASGSPISVAGLSIGRFKKEEAKPDNTGVFIAAYANEDQPDWVSSFNRQASHVDDLTHDVSTYNRMSGDTDALGSMSTIPLMKRNLSEAQLSVQLYSNYFGVPSPQQLSVTQQTPCDFGQAWPGLVYLPICAFFDDAVRHAIGLNDTRGYWQVVGPHEVAHQWWGHTVGWDSYRDQWMSEGFAEFSASLFMQKFYKPEDYRKFWREELQLLTERSTTTNFRGIDLPLTLGYRLATRRTGYDIPRRLIYPKGAFVLHMVRTMMHDTQTGDRQFREMMQDFVNTFRNQPATTEDFKATVEKHMTPAMDLDHNHKMDWFFDPFVYGTVLPLYDFDQTIQPASDGKYKLHFRLTQSNVPDSFKMLVPVYLELANGTVVKMGGAKMVGNTAVEQDVMLPMKEAPKRALINANFDVLALQN